VYQNIEIFSAARHATFQTPKPKNRLLNVEDQRRFAAQNIEISETKWPNHFALLNIEKAVFSFGSLKFPRGLEGGKISIF